MKTLTLLGLLAAACAGGPDPGVWLLDRGEQEFGPVGEPACSGDGELEAGSLSAQMYAGPTNSVIDLAGCLWRLTSVGADRWAAPAEQYCALVRGDSATLVTLDELTAEVFGDQLLIERSTRVGFQTGVTCTVESNYTFSPAP